MTFTEDKTEETSEESSLTRFHNLCGSMVHAASEGRWEDVAEYERQRQDISLDDIVHCATLDKTGDALGVLEEALTMNRKIMELACRSRDEIGSSLDAIKLKEKAVNAYLR